MWCPDTTMPHIIRADGERTFDQVLSIQKPRHQDPTIERIIVSQKWLPNVVALVPTCTVATD